MNDQIPTLEEKVDPNSMTIDELSAYLKFLADKDGDEIKRECAQRMVKQRNSIGSIIRSNSELTNDYRSLSKSNRRLENKIANYRKAIFIAVVANIIIALSVYGYFN